MSGPRVVLGFPMGRLEGGHACYLFAHHCGLSVQSSLLSASAPCRPAENSHVPFLIVPTRVEGVVHGADKVR